MTGRCTRDAGDEVKPAQGLKGARAVVVRTCNILSITILTLIVVIAAGLLAAQALGFKPMAVLSGSMEPAYATGSVVFVDTNADVGSVAVGDVITYTIGGGDTVVTHRVIAVDRDRGLFTTKGDANDSADGPVPFSGFVGRTAGFYIPQVGTLLLMMDTTRGIAVALFALAFIIALLMVPVILSPPNSFERAAKPRGVTVIRDGDGVQIAQDGDGVRGTHFRESGQGVS